MKWLDMEKGLLMDLKERFYLQHRDHLFKIIKVRQKMKDKYICFPLFLP